MLTPSKSSAQAGSSIAAIAGHHAPCSAHPECDEFISLASHELLTPVTALRLQVQHMQRLLAQHPEPAPARMAGIVEAFDRQLGRLNLLCDEILNAMRIRANQLSVACDEVDFGGLVANIIDRVAHRAEDRNRIELRVIDAPWGSWDTGLIEQIVRHLLRNAIIYGEGKPITIVASQIDDSVELVVKDRGIGIAPEDQKRIFEPFERAVPAANFGGLGLGLYIVRAIVEAHGGSIRVESAPGHGATFIVQLPSAPHKSALSPLKRGRPHRRPYRHCRLRRTGVNRLPVRLSLSRTSTS
jgi:two-component system, OmpR family, sensor histidine kinase SenX3